MCTRVSVCVSRPCPTDSSEHVWILRNFVICENLMIAVAGLYQHGMGWWERSCWASEDARVHLQEQLASALGRQRLTPHAQLQPNFIVLLLP